MIDNLQESLTLALSKLDEKFRKDPESLHFAISIVFSSIFKKSGLSCIIVGGQSAAYWLRLPGSNDIDFVSPDLQKIANILEQCGFTKSSDLSFRYVHPTTNIMIELVGEQIAIADIKTPGSVLVEPSDIDDALVRSLMPGPSEVLDPVLVFINYLDASSHDSIWFTFENEGALAVERAKALLALYKEYIIDGLRDRYKAGEISERFRDLLDKKFNIVLR